MRKRQQERSVVQPSAVGLTAVRLSPWFHSGVAGEVQPWHQAGLTPGALNPACRPTEAVCPELSAQLRVLAWSRMETPDAVRNRRWLHR